jgi:hypothetical protein
MALEHWFRLSCYVTLALSCSALVFAEAPFLPDLPICLPPVLALLLLAWWVERRWRLPNWGANVLGVLIAIGGVAWLARQLTDDDSLLMRIPLQLALLPYMGPLLMAALLVKVFGSRDTGDFWRLQGLGLMQVGLGCVLDGGLVFGSLLAAYLTSALACLALRYRLSADRRDASPTPPLSAGWLVSFTFRWTLLIAVPALLLFLLTPRRDSNSWEPLGSLRSGYGRSRTQGGSEEINLNITGRIELDDEVALQVAAVDAAGQPKLDLPADQRWRGAVLDMYEDGQRELPDFGPHQFFLTFTVSARQPGALVLAEPIRFGPPSARLPVVTLSGEGRHKYQYHQVVPAGEDSSRMPAEGVRFGGYRRRLLRLPPQPEDTLQNRPRLLRLPSQLEGTLQNWTVELLRRLAQEPRYRLPEGVRTALGQPSPSLVIDPDHWEAVARALTLYLAASGEFTYALDLTRQDLSIDPVLDFLINVKQGHCERYATGLALMLRSLGIPARVVKGFRGCDSQGDGTYLVRHRHAHAWVEIQVPRPGWRERASKIASTVEGELPRPGWRERATPSPFPRSWRSSGFPMEREATFDWLSLDPTPPGEAAAPALRFSLAHLWQEIQRIGQQGWQTLIVDYNAQEQADLWDALRSGRPLTMLLKLGLAAPAAVAVFCVGLFLRRLSRRRPEAGVRTTGTAAFYLRLVEILGRYASLRPSFGQTPREYSEAARALLQTRPALGALAELPRRVVDLFYRVRFGGQPLREGERQALDAELDRFAEVVRTEPRP